MVSRPSRNLNTGDLVDTIAVTRRFDLTCAQWARLEPLLLKGKKSGRPSAWTRRQLIDGIRRRVRVGAPSPAGRQPRPVAVVGHERGVRGVRFWRISGPTEFASRASRTPVGGSGL
jgi:hypothetical protein